MDDEGAVSEYQAALQRQIPVVGLQCHERMSKIVCDEYTIQKNVQAMKSGHLKQVTLDAFYANAHMSAPEPITYHSFSLGDTFLPPTELTPARRIAVTESPAILFLRPPFANRCIDQSPVDNLLAVKRALLEARMRGHTRREAREQESRRNQYLFEHYFAGVPVDLENADNLSFNP
jgi:hypothetical protein